MARKPRLKTANNKLRKVNKELEESNKKLSEDKEEQKSIILKLQDQITSLNDALHKAFEAIRKYKEYVVKINNPPCDYGIFIRRHPEGGPNEIDVLIDGSIRKVLFAPEDEKLSIKDLKCGWQLVCNTKGNVIKVIKDYWKFGKAVTFKQRIGEDMALVTDEGETTQQCFLSPELKREKLEEGDYLLNYNGLLIKVLPKTEEAEHFMKIEEISDLTFEHVGGLRKQIEEIREAILPFVERQVYMDDLKGKEMPRGIILDGPPGCGKTLLAKVIASQLARERGVKGYFMGLTSTELINKYVGETERKLRELVERAEEKVGQGNLVIIFIDEIDALIRSRDFAMEKEPWKGDTVAQFCGILDGIKPLGDIMFIGATNHKNLIDSAILRPGRMSVHIRVSRPTRKGAEEILRIYLTPDLPFAKKYYQNKYKYIDHFGGGKKKIVVFNNESEKIRDHFVKMIIKRIFYTAMPIDITLDDDNVEKTIKIDNRIEVTNENAQETRYLKNFISGDMLKNLVEKAKRIALKRYIRQKETNPRAKAELTKKDFFLAADSEFRRIVSSFKKVKKENESKIGFTPSS